MSFIAVAITAGVLAVAAATVGTISAYRAGRAQEKMYQAEADMAYKQASLAEKRSQDQQELIQDKAAGESRQQHREQIKARARQRAAMGAMGIGGVSAEDIISDTAMIQEADASTLRWNADTATWETRVAGDYESWQFQVKGALSRAKAKTTHNQTNWALAKGIINIAGTAVSAVGGVKSAMGATPTTPSSAYNSRGELMGTRSIGASGGIKAIGGGSSFTSSGFGSGSRGRGFGQGR